METPGGKDRSGNVLAVIPAYNEEETIREILQKVKTYRGEYLDDILIVDDASRDRTAEISEEEGVNVISHAINRGYGATQRTGHRVAIEKGFDYVLQLDADGQHDPKCIPEFLEYVGSDYDMVLGSRWKNNSYKNFGWTRRIGITFFTNLVNLLTNSSNITDVTSGYKLYRVDMLKELSRASDRHPAVEQMMEILNEGYWIKEISIEMPQREKGQSHLDLSNLALYPVRAAEAILKVVIYRF